jgi:hypothetical protein
MRKLHALALLGIPLFLATGFVSTRVVQEGAQQEPPVPGPSYQFESQHFSMQETGRLLERLGTEIQRTGTVTVGGNAYAVTGFGGIEFSLSRRGNRTGIEIGFGSDGRTTPPTGGRRPRTDYDPYQRGGGNWQPSDVADLVAELGETLASTGVFVLENHRVDFRGAATIDQRLIESTLGRGLPYELEVHVLFGEGEFAGPDDDEDYEEDQGYGLIRSIARAQQQDRDQAAVAQMWASLAEDLTAGRVRVGDEELAVGENVRFGLTHVTAVDGQYDKIEFSLSFGPRPEPGAREPRWGDEAFNEPTADLAAILQRIGAQILEDGTFELGGEVFTVSRTANWEIGANPRGFGVEVSYHQPLEER